MGQPAVESVDASLASARHGVAGLGLAQLGLGQLGSARAGSVQPISERLGLARLGSIRFGSGRLGSGRLGWARLGSIWLCLIGLGSARLRSTGPGSACTAIWGQRTEIYLGTTHGKNPLASLSHAKYVA